MFSMSYLRYGWRDLVENENLFLTVILQFLIASDNTSSRGALQAVDFHDTNELIDLFINI